MEFEIEEFAGEMWLDEESQVACANHAPHWCADRAAGGQTAVWIPEEGRALTAKREEPVS